MAVEDVAEESSAPDLWGQVAVIGWIGDGPDGAEEAQLLLYPTGGGLVDAEPAMVDVAAQLGGVPGRVVRSARVFARVDDGWVAVGSGETGALFEYQVGAEWQAVCLVRGRVVLTVGPAPLGDGDLARYAHEHGHRLATVMLRAVAG